MSDFHLKVKENFLTIDTLLSRLPMDSKEFNMLFAIRTYYSTFAERKIRKTTLILQIAYCIKALLYWFFQIAIFPIKRIELDNLHEQVVLGDWHFDDFLSKQIDVKRLSLKAKYGIKGFGKKVALIPSIIFFSFKLFWYLDIRKLIISLPQVLNYYLSYLSDINIVRIIIVEDDIFPGNYGLLLKAKEKDIKRVKIEYAIIDSVFHQNCFCDYYFYPTVVHKKIREQCLYNTNLKYIEGGYLNAFSISNKIYLKPNKTVVTYFTEHCNFFEKNDLFYIDEVLKMLPYNGILNIKIHPYDIISRYLKYKNNKNVIIYSKNDIDNADLISNSSICLSIFSTMSLEAKNICNNSFFINFDINNSPFQYDYSIFESFFDVIDNPVLLKRVIEGDFIPKSYEEFRKNVNMTYPNTFQVLKKFINSL